MSLLRGVLWPPPCSEPLRVVTGRTACRRCAFDGDKYIRCLQPVFTAPAKKGARKNPSCLSWSDRLVRQTTVAKCNYPNLHTTSLRHHIKEYSGTTKQPALRPACNYLRDSHYGSYVCKAGKPVGVQKSLGMNCPSRSCICDIVTTALCPRSEADIYDVQMFLFPHTFLLPVQLQPTFAPGA